MRSLHDHRADTRLKAVEALNLAGYGAAADAVAPLVADPDSNVRFAAIDAELTFFLNESVGAVTADGKTPKHSRAQDAFDAGPLVRNGAVAPPSVIDALVRASADPAPRIRFDALHALGVIAEPPLAPDVAETLAAGLDSSDPTTRIATARVLGRLRVASAGDKLIAALNDPSVTEQKYATEALGLIKNERSLGSLLERLNFYKTGDMAAETLLALARIAHVSAREAFRAHLADTDATMRAAALEGLGRLKDADSGEAFAMRRQKDTSVAVRLAATFALAHFDEPDVPTLARGLTSAETYAPGGRLPAGTRPGGRPGDRDVPQDVPRERPARRPHSRPGLHWHQGHRADSSALPEGSQRSRCPRGGRRHCAAVALGDELIVRRGRRPRRACRSADRRTRTERPARSRSGAATGGGPKGVRPTWREWGPGRRTRVPRAAAR